MLQGRACETANKGRLDRKNHPMISEKDPLDVDWLLHDGGIIDAESSPGSAVPVGGTLTSGIAVWGIAR